MATLKTLTTTEKLALVLNPAKQDWVYDAVMKFNGPKVITIVTGIIGLLVFLAAAAIGTEIKNAVNAPLGFIDALPSAPAIIFGFIIGLSVFLLLYNYFKGRYDLVAEREEGVTRAKTNTFGDAHFATKKELEQVATFTDPRETNGFVVGQFGEEAIYLPRRSKTSPGRYSLMSDIYSVIGTTGSGKTYSVLYGNICETIKRGESYIVTDPSGQIYRKTAALAREKGYNVNLINAKDFSRSDPWPIIDEIRRTNDVAFATQKAFIIAQTMWDNTSTSGEFAKTNEFWDSNNINLLIFLLLYVALSPSCNGERNMKTFFDTLRIINRTIQGETPREVIYVFDEEVQKMEAEALLRGGEDPCVVFYRKFQDSGSNRPLIPSGLAARLKALDLPSVRNMLSSKGLDLMKVTEEKTAVYLMTPEFHKTFDFVLSSLVACFIVSLDEVWRRNGERIKIPTWLFLDEFTNLGSIPDWTRIQTNIRKYDVGVVMFFQDIARLRAVYPKSYESILGNCSMIIILAVGSGDILTAEWVSKTFGEFTTIQKATRFQGHSIDAFSGDFTPQYHMLEGRRLLLRPEDVTGLEAEYVIGHMKPTTGKKVNFKLEAYNFDARSPFAEYTRLNTSAAESYIPKRGLITDPVFDYIMKYILIGNETCLEPGQIDDAISMTMGGMARGAGQSAPPKRKYSIKANRAAPARPVLPSFIPGPSCMKPPAPAASQQSIYLKGGHCAPATDEELKSISLAFGASAAFGGGAGRNAYFSLEEDLDLEKLNSRGPVCPELPEEAAQKEDGADYYSMMGESCEDEDCDQLFATHAGLETDWDSEAE